MSDERLITIVVFDGMKLLDLAGPAEVFAEANRFGANYRLVVASVDGRDVSTSIGSPFSVTETIDSIECADTVLVAGGDVLIGSPLNPTLVAALAQLQARCRRIASICTGAFLLAQAGMLDHRRATTHWRHTGLLQRAFPTSPSSRMRYSSGTQMFSPRPGFPRASIWRWLWSRMTTDRRWSETWPGRWSST